MRSHRIENRRDWLRDWLESSLQRTIGLRDETPEAQLRPPGEDLESEIAFFRSALRFLQSGEVVDAPGTLSRPLPIAIETVNHLGRSLRRSSSIQHAPENVKTEAADDVRRLRGLIGYIESAWL